MKSAHRFTALTAALIGALAILALPSLAAAKDRNHDRIPDRWEKHHHLSLNVNQAGRDQDGDQLRNRAEFLAGDNPRDRDSDDDGVIDGNENAGTISSFDAASGKLTIALFGGDTLSGLVNGETEIECEHEHSTASTSDRGGDNPGDQQGEEEPGDDKGGENEPGDDNGDNSGPGRGGDDNGEATCTAADLVAGTVVQEAELRAANGTATFEKVELGS